MTALNNIIKPDTRQAPFYSATSQLINGQLADVAADLSQQRFTLSQKPAQAPYQLGDNPLVLANIYEAEVRLTCWQRELDVDSLAYVNWLLERGRLLPLRLVAAPEALTEQLEQDLPDHANRKDFIEDVVYLADMFACLFGMEEVGVRLSLLKEAMCPRFHVDRIGARMVCTYAGSATEWLPNEVVDRSKLGRGSNGLDDHESGLYPAETIPNQMSAGDVVIMKGDTWPEQEGQGLVHRSPACTPQAPRLFLSMDVM